MRLNGFLRTPIRSEHQSRLLNPRLLESSLSEKWKPGAPHPQTLQLSFDLAPGVTEVQIALLWEGMLRFIPETSAGGAPPLHPDEVVEANHSNWPLTGALVLRTPSGLTEAFAAHVPGISPPPATVLYSRVRLTREFLFETLRQSRQSRLVFDGSIVDPRDPDWHSKLLIKFLQGKAAIWCPVDPNDPARDFTLHPMPAIELAPPGAPTTLRVTVAALSPEVLNPTWFSPRPEYDDLTGEPLVPPELGSYKEQLYNPAHPGHAVIPPQAIYQAAAPEAYAPDHAHVPLAGLLRAPLPSGLSYYRIHIERPPIPGKPVSSNPQRPFPLFGLCWSSAESGPAQWLSIPLMGRLYLPLAPWDYTFWATPRAKAPQHVPGVAQLLFGRKSETVKYLGLPDPSLRVTPGNARVITLQAYMQDYDSKYVWESFRSVAPKRDEYKRKAEADWNATAPLPDSTERAVLDWFIQPTSRQMASFNPIYGFIRESAGRHGLAPEFLQAVVMGEGLIQRFQQLKETGFNPDEPMSAFGLAGLDLIVYRAGRVPAGKVPVPPEVTDAEERAEYTFNLVTSGYLAPEFAERVSYAATIRREEMRPLTLHIGLIAGWEAVIELVAAELHVRLDEMLACFDRPITDENQRRYLAYVRFNATLKTAKQHVPRLTEYVQRWSGPPRDDGQDPRFNALQRIAVAQWYEDAGVYR